VAILEAAIRDAEVRAAADGSSVDALLAREREQVSGRVPTPEQQVTYLTQALDSWRGRAAALEAQERP
jgi:hypothetical protein